MNFFHVYYLGHGLVLKASHTLVLRVSTDSLQVAATLSRVAFFCQAKYLVASSGERSLTVLSAERREEERKRALRGICVWVDREREGRIW